MENDVIFRCATVLFGAVGAAKIISDLVIGGRGRLREEYKFAKEFIDGLQKDPSMHPFLKEKGYQAIAGDRRLSAAEIEYLLSLKNPDRAIRDYVLGRDYLEDLLSTGNLRLNFRAKYRRPWARIWRKAGFFALYFVFAILAVSPILAPKLFGGDPTQTIVALSGCLAGFGPFAWMAVKAGARINRAEKIVKFQSEHTQRIVVNSASTYR